MNRILTVKGIGNVSVKPDFIVLTLILKSHQHDYDRTMALAAESVAMLQDAIELVGFEKESLKTMNFGINTQYENYRDKDNNYLSRFNGYQCEQRLKIEFDYNMNVLSIVLTVIAKTLIDPELNIQFSVKDKSAVSEELLINATKNARRKAEILANASGVSLGDLISIDYNWGELRLYSQTSYALAENRNVMDSFSSPDIIPDDITVNDTVSFVWEIK